jgi:4-hydroxy-tetrahydrodipicolinate synthase
MSNISGTGVALITPFNNDLTIDFKSLANLIEHVTDGGIDFLVILGTTAETTSLSINEKKEVINFIIEKNKKRLPLVLGIGGNNTNKVIKEILSTDLSSFDAILSVTPYYNKPSQEGLYFHYKEISQASPIPIILYNVPSRTGVNMSANITLKLANDFLNIIAIKEASGDLKQINQILDEKPANFNVLSGDDALTLEMINSGASGVISVIGQSHPKEFSNMVSAGLDNDKLQANKIHNDLFGLYHFLYSEGNPSGIKALLSLMNLCENNLRLPLVPISNSLHNELKQYIDGLH